ncbi:uncharacterized protein LOC117318709 [Pecten maximus]|uniref:uncharacterized protein LOC117318709 n=1 Tax=Pecten maximus TaxID=6579 RepID=UPI001458324F|nr:uncharacterized protein LOC117318709 [Pecten maximus]
MRWSVPSSGSSAAGRYKKSYAADVLTEPATYGHTAIVGLLLDKGAQPDKGDALKAASSRGHTEIVRLLLDGGAQPDKADVLTEAATYGHTAIVGLLLDKGAQPDKGDALKAASSRGHTEIVRLLLDGGAQPDKADVLTEAATYGHTAIVGLLLDKGAQPDKDVIEKARSRGHTEIVELLLDKDRSIGRTEMKTSVSTSDTPDASIRSGDDDGDTKSLIEIVKKRDIEKFETLEKTTETTESILHIVAVFGSSEMLECMRKWKVIEWDEEREIHEHIFGEALKGLTVGNATALYLATLMERTEMVCSLIKYSGEDNIKRCFRILHLSDEMEEIYMLDQAEKLKTKYYKLRPAVIPGHRVGKDGQRTRAFIVYSTHENKASNYELGDGLGLVMIRNPYIYKKERECTEDGRKMVPYKDTQRAENALSLHQRNLWANHSNLNIINVSPVIYRNNGDDIIEKPCIALYCSTKGVVPLGEPEFPKQLELEDGDFIDVDVHEGYFKRGGYNSLPSDHFHSTLKMGCDIGRSTPEYDACGNPLQLIGGTHGPFVKFNNNIGFLTCAHVLFDIPVTTKCVDYTHTGNNTVEVVQPSVDSTAFAGSPCGHVHRAIFNPQLDPSIDVAVVEVTDPSRLPTAGQFANAKHSSYKNAGFDQLPEYNSGSIQEDLTHFGTTHIVFKFGGSSDVTKGTLDVCGTHVRPLSTALGLPRCTEKVEMQNQYQVSGTHPTMTFFAEGDSGSPVFMKSDTGELVLIGMAIGHAYVGTNPFPLAVVTPIGAILKTLGTQYSIASFP